MNICKNCGKEFGNVIKIRNTEYETETHNFDKNLSEITIPNGWRLWTAQECIEFYNDVELRKKLNLEDCWFFIKQPFIFNEEEKFVARFSANLYGADLDCERDPYYHTSRIGVRFARDIK